MRDHDKDGPWACDTCGKNVWKRLDGTFTNCDCIKSTISLETAIFRYCDWIKAAYEKRGGPPVNGITSMFEPCKGGKKYIRIHHVERHAETGEVCHDSAVCFVDEAGDVWKPAGWKGPTKNFKRGNVFTDTTAPASF